MPHHDNVWTPSTSIYVTHFLKNLSLSLGFVTKNRVMLLVGWKVGVEEIGGAERWSCAVGVRVVGDIVDCFSCSWYLLYLDALVSRERGRAGTWYGGKYIGRCVRGVRDPGR